MPVTQKALVRRKSAPSKAYDFDQSSDLQTGKPNVVGHVHLFDKKQPAVVKTNTVQGSSAEKLTTLAKLSCKSSFRRQGSVIFMPCSHLTEPYSRKTPSLPELTALIPTTYHYLHSEQNTLRITPNYTQLQF